MSGFFIDNAPESDTAPANGTITTVDLVTASQSGANGQIFYFGTPTTNSAAVFTLASIETVMLQTSILGAGGTLVVEVSMDGGSFWMRPNVFQIATQSYANSFTLPFAVLVNTSGMTSLRVRAITSWTGTATVIVRESINSHALTVADALPGGLNNIGSITNITGTVSLPSGASNSAIQATQQTSLSSIDTKLTSQATAAIQATQQTSLTSIDGKTPALFNGQQPDVDVLNTAGQMRAQNATTSATEALGAATILANRKCLLITPTAGTVYWGFANTVTVATGTPIFKNQTFTIAAGPAQHIYIIAASTIDCRIGEAS